MEGEIVSSFILTALGTAAVALSLIEIAAVFVQSGSVAWSLIRRLSGRNQAPESQMEAAMFWIQAVGLMIAGCALIAIGLS